MRAQLSVGNVQLVHCAMPKQEEENCDTCAGCSTGCSGGRATCNTARDGAAVVVIMQGGERRTNVGGGDGHGSEEMKGEMVEVRVERAYEVELPLAMGPGARVAHAGEGDHAQDVEEDIVW